MGLEKVARRLLLITACAPLLLLAGCPQETPVTAEVPVQAMAPTQPAPVPAAGSQGASAPGPQSKPQPSAARDQQLINQVETIYSTGVTNYRAGHLDAARQDFDLAVDTMLTSGLDLKGDPQLADEFDHLLNAVNSLEMDALKQGNGLSPVLEEAPLEGAEAEATFPANPELTAKLKKELTITSSDLPLVINDQVAGYINAFANSPSFHAHMLRSMERAGKYKVMMQRVLREEGVPQDLIYLAVAESGFQPQALNPKSGAGGIWQFMGFQGAYGLTRNGWVDERFDPEKSTRAYAKYMKGIYNQLGDWYLAMAGYDWGPGNVQRAVMRTGYADFWELYRRNALPKETKNYVPQVLAAVIMAKNPEKYGLDKMVPDAAVVSDTVTTNYAIDLRLVADLTDASLPEIVALNPSLLRLRTPSEMEFDLHIPVGTKDVYAGRIKAIPDDKRVSWRFHNVKPGESLEGIATALHSRASEIASANGIGVAESIGAGDELVVPIASVSSGAPRPQHYSVRRGDTLVTIADRFNVSVEELRKWNHLSSGSVGTGRTLSVTEPVRLAPSMRVRGRGARNRNRALTSSAGKSSRTRGSIGHSQHASSRSASRKAPKTGGASSRTASKKARKATR